MSKYIRKTRDVYDIEVKYGNQPYEVECSEYTYEEAVERMGEYFENVCAYSDMYGGAHVRIVKHRERIENV